MKKQKLYDFSVGYLIIFLVTYAALFSLALYNLIATSRKITSSVFLVILAASFVFILIRFGILTAAVDGNGIRYRKQEISKENACFLAKYDTRFREPVIIVRRKDVDYFVLGEKEARKQSIIVQATDRNRKILGEFFGTPIDAVKKPKIKLGRRK